MSVAFFYPLAWLAALAIGVPVWLHLRRREDPKVVNFSAMRFLDDQPLARSQPLWPRDWPLLLLRLLAVVALVAAFSWPYFSQPQTTPVRESRVYILDNTMSHQLTGRFQAARNLLTDELEKSDTSTQLAVIELTATPRVHVRFGDDARAAAGAVRRLKPSFERGSYLAAFRQAQGLLAQSLGERKRIILLGDSQENQWTEGLHSPPFLEGVDVDLPRVEHETVANLSLSEPLVRRRFTGEKAAYECAVRLSRCGDCPTPSVVFMANGQEIARRDVEWQAADSKTPESPKNPRPESSDAESITLVVEGECDPQAWSHGEVRLDGELDELPADDRVVFSLPPLREGRIALLAESTYLRTALAPEIMRGRWHTQVLTAADLAASAPQAYDVVCVESRFLTSPKARDLLLDALNKGSGVVLLVGRDTLVASEFLRQFGIEFVAEQRRSGSEAGFRFVFFEHPVMQAFRSRDFGSLDEITVERFRELRVADASPLIFSANGEPLVFESVAGKGKMLVLAFHLDREETNWPLHPTFVPFVDKCLQYVRPQSEQADTNYEPGEACVWTLPPDVRTREVVLRPADRRGGLPRVKAPVVDGQARFRLPGRPGQYDLRYDEDGEIQNVLNVNPSPLESHLTFAEAPAALTAWRREAAAPNADEDAPSRATHVELTEREILRQRVWWWLLVAGLAAVVAETVWISLRKEKT